MKFFMLLFITLFVLQCSHSAQSNNEKQEEQAPPEASSPGEETVGEERSFRFAIISDLNGSYGSKVYNSNVARSIDYMAEKDNKIDFVISTGDMVAGQKNNLDYAGMWEGFHRSVTRPLLKSQIPFLPSPGNHDAYKTRVTERNHYKRTWEAEKPLGPMPNIQWVKNVKQNFPFQYAVVINGALFISLDNTAAQPWAESTLQWLQQVLEIEKDQKLKFIYGHIPLLPFAFKKEREYVARGSVSFLNDVEALFEKYKVDAFFSGHSHVYYPGRRDQHTEYISVPLLGSGLRYLIKQGSSHHLSERGFLIVTYNNQGDWSLEHREASRFTLVSDREFPANISIPASNTSKCSSCSSFPTSHLLDARKRIIYKRRDL